uniref:Bestrophin homolog n=1 Tax=Chlamydomonas leiostraca TaxID=1034604 RepID=A0A7S0S385_9CHLO|mmetsp:Transcript_682/g.1806  ORF Transcript_682/g.1806 Transcript_682/m.1806 type:complete len:371 (+) Transcript_682:79-1191(+)
MLKSVEALRPGGRCCHRLASLAAPAVSRSINRRTPLHVRALIARGSEECGGHGTVFTFGRWAMHRDAQHRYQRHIANLLTSRTWLNLTPPLTGLTVVAGIQCLYQELVVRDLLPGYFPLLQMSDGPFELTSFALSLLLVFRTNSSYARFVEGRLLWGALVRHSRDWTRMAANYFPGELRGRAARYVQVLAFVLKSHLRSGRTRATVADPSAFRDDPTIVVQELLPCSEADAVLTQTNRPFYVVCRMTQIARDACAAGIPRHISHSIEHTLSELMAVIGGCDRILGTPIPLSYTRHTSRSLVLWLATLPVALWPVAGWLTLPTMAVLAFIFLGIDEIGVEIEEPFCILPLLPLCRTIVNDVNTVMTMPMHH